MTTERKQYIALLKLIKRHGLSGQQAAAALILFFHAPDFGFCRAARFVWRARDWYHAGSRETLPGRSD